MRKYCINILFLIIWMGGFVSCKNYLDIKPDKKLVIPDNIDALQALLDYSLVMNNKRPAWDIASADNYYLTSASYNSLTPRAKGAYTWNNIDYDFGAGNDWSFLYDIVNYANTVLDRINDIRKDELNARDWDNVMGSALLYRAYAFLTAAYIFSPAYDKATAESDYGIVLRTTSDFNIPSVRANVKSTYEQVISDLKKSVLLLPETPKHVMRPSKPAAYALLARTYLSMGVYDSCFKYADLCLKLKRDLMDFNSLPLNSGVPFPRFNSEVIFHSTIKIFTFFNVRPSTARVDSALFMSYSDNDLRKTLFFRNIIDEVSAHTFKGNYDQSPATLFTGIATDEVWLMRAECYARLGNMSAALSDLNTLLEKRWEAGTFIPHLPTADRDVLQLILNERRKELIFRGLRWMDLKRLNKEGANIYLERKMDGKTYTLPPNDKRYALPLPTDVVNMTGMPQNK